MLKGWKYIVCSAHVQSVFKALAMVNEKNTFYDLYQTAVSNLWTMDT